MKVAALCASAGRHQALERSIGFFLAQDYKNSIMIIFENSESIQALSLDIPMEDRNRIILYNQCVNSETKQPYQSVGEIWNDALKLVPSDVDVISIWNDDDGYLPHHLSSGVKGMEKGAKSAYKPKRSISMYGGGFRLDENNFESSFFVRTSHLFKHGFGLTDGDYDLKWLNPLFQEGDVFVDPEGAPTMVYDWGGPIPVYKVSGDMANPENFKNIRTKNNDHGDGIITPSNPNDYYQLTGLQEVVGFFLPGFTPSIIGDSIIVDNEINIKEDYMPVIDKAKKKYPDQFIGKNVLQIGIAESCKNKFDVNSRVLVLNDVKCEGVGLDVPIYQFERKEKYDVIIAINSLNKNSLLEHSIKNIITNLKVGGLLIYSAPFDTWCETRKYVPTESFPDLEYYKTGSIINTYGIKSAIEKSYTMDDFCLITAQSDERWFAWETEVQINNLRKYNLSDKFKVLVYWERNAAKTTINQDWLDLYEKYREVEFSFYCPEIGESIILDRHHYSSLVRPYCLNKYWNENPTMESKVVFYMDSDVVFINKPDFESMLKTGRCYVTDTGHYLGIDYMQRKAAEVNIDPFHFVDIAAKITGISREDVIRNDSNCGGAQYVLKNIPVGFWDKVQKDTLDIRKAFWNENQKYFQELGAARADRSVENAGIQSWCADMWGVLYNLYYFKLPVQAPSFMKSAWTTDPMDASLPGQRLENVSILHNTGQGSSEAGYQFLKINYRKEGKYRYQFPWDENFSYVSHDYFSYLYVQEIINAAKSAKTI